jgi:hypothetical protein
MDAQSPRSGRCPVNTSSSSQPQDMSTIDEIEKTPAKPLDRRTLLKVGGIGATATTLASVGSLAWAPKRTAQAQANATKSDIQFDIGAFVHPATTQAGIPVQFGVVFTFFAPATLTRNPTKTDQTTLTNALNTIEAHYDFSPSGVFTLVSYGIPYFNRLSHSLVSSHMPTLAFDDTRSVLEEAVAGPTDFGPQNPGITKLQANFRVPVQIEKNDVLFTLRSDSLENIIEVVAWLQGSNLLKNGLVASPHFNGLFRFGATRFNFVQPGLPRQLADSLASVGTAPFSTIASTINPASSMWMGFVDQQLNGSAPNAKIVTFAGTGPATSGVGATQLTSAKAGDYFDNGSIQHLSHVLDDLEQYYTKESGTKFPDGPETYTERIQYMFHSQHKDGSHTLPYPEDPHDGFTNGGGMGAPTGTLAEQQKSAVLSDFTMGPMSIYNNYDPAVLPHKKLRIGHEFALQRSSRAQDGTPLHIRNDGPGLSSLDVPDGSTVATLEFSIFVPTSDFFQAMRVNSASLDLVKEGQNGGTGTSVPPGIEAADAGDDGLERFISATRRQNFLIPPRRHRSFPLLELT